MFPVKYSFFLLAPPPVLSYYCKKISKKKLHKLNLHIHAYNVVGAESQLLENKKNIVPVMLAFYSRFSFNILSPECLPG